MLHCTRYDGTAELQTVSKGKKRGGIVTEDTALRTKKTRT